MPDETRSRRWVATERSATEAARSYTGWALRRPRLWVVLGVLEVLFAISIGGSFDERYGAATRWVFGPLYAVVPTLAVGALVVGLNHRLTLRRFRQRLRPGTTLESEFGDDSVTLRSPLSESTLYFHGLTAVRRVGDWVHLQQLGAPIVTVSPAALFPAGELERMQRAVDGAAHR